MRESEPVALNRDLEVVEIPAGTKATLPRSTASYCTRDCRSMRISRWWS